ncbi:MAG TPA: efflux RND transporter periplasmic adaptor subunit [Thermoanaerobaculia bacterium]
MKKTLMLTLLILGAGLLSACNRAVAQGAATPPPAGVTAAPVVAREITEWDEFTGRLEAVESVAVRPRVSGYVAAVKFDEGSIVKQGDLLFLIDPRPFQAEVDRLRAELLRARATVERAENELKRAETLAAESAMSSEERGRRAAFAAESAAQVAAVEAALRAAELNLEFTRVTSPIDGRVGRAIVTAGNLVSNGDTLMTSVVSIDPIYATFEADEQTFLRYGPSTSLRASVEIRMGLANEKDFPRTGKMDFLDNQVNPATGTIRGRAVFRNDDRALTPGLFVRLRLPGSGSYPGVLIQDRAVGTDLDKRYVYVVENGAVEYREVELGPIVDGLRVVRNGLVSGDVVVVNGLQRVRPGAPVTAQLVQMTN